MLRPRGEYQGEVYGLCPSAIILQYGGKGATQDTFRGQHLYIPQQGCLLEELGQGTGITLDNPVTLKPTTSINTSKARLCVK